MLLKKPTITICSCSGLSSAISGPASITSWGSSPSPVPLRPLKIAPSIPKPWRPSSSRYYATVRDEPSDQSDDPHTPSWPASKSPTPYEIFDQAKSDPYSKKTFLQLVKLYHPDRSHHTSHLHATIPHGAKIDRYRLVVAANDILSDPAKRRAYDLYGAGWGGQGDMRNNFREADKAWRARAGTAAYNATWEDWERWYEKQRAEGKRQDPMYMSNAMFVVTMVAFVLLGGWGQAKRAGSNGLRLVEMEERKDSDIGGDMWKRRKEKAYLTREDRVENFLREREGWVQRPTNRPHTPRD